MDLDAPSATLPIPAEDSMVALTCAELLRESEGLWFQDCGLVIQADTNIFRVSREFLAMQSHMF
ncbi:hypothetical protein B0H19DRAFT_159467 [Mycena capillaripes]|nr:hypothetical protein B0H19DRAFT_159467 [Mycena capillaripes]